MKILLHYAWGHGSTGDMAIAPGMISLIKQVIPGAKISLFTMNTDDARHREVKGYLKSLFPDVTVYKDPFAILLSERDPFRRQWDFFDLCLEPEKSVKRAAEIDRGAVSAWKEADLRLYTPSMQLTFHPVGGVSGLRFWLPVVFAQRLGLKYALYGQSFGHIGYPGHRLLKRFLQDALMVTVRDTTSLSVLKEAGVDRPHIGFVPDSTIFFDRRDDEWADQYLNSNDLLSNDYLLVLPRTYGFWGVNPSEETIMDRMEKIAYSIEQWVVQTDLPVFIGYELPREKLRTQEYLLPLLSAKTRSRTHVFQGDWNAEQMLSIYAKARVLLTMERYAVFFAMTVGLPTLHATTSERGLRLEAMDEVGLEDFRQDIDAKSQQELAEGLLRLHMHRDNFSRRFISGADALRQRALDQIGVLSAHLTDFSQPAS